MVVSTATMVNAMTISKQRRIATVQQASELYPAFSTSSLRYLIFKSKNNGFARCIRKIGSRVLIDLDEFDKWLDDHALLLQE